MTTYEQWRITYQSSEQAARAAFAELQRLRGALIYSRDYLDENPLNSIGHNSKAHMQMRHALSETHDQAQPDLRAAVPVVWHSVLSEFVRAMRDYEMLVDCDPTHEHRVMMGRAEALLAGEPREHFDVFMICHAYEAGFGMGADHRDLPNPYTEGTEQRIAWDVGYETGAARNPKTEAGEQYGGQVPCEPGPDHSVDANKMVKEDSLQEVAERVCTNCPPGCVISLCIEDGAAWVELREDRNPENTPLPDPADKTLVEQLNDALCVANGWGDS